MSEGPFGPATDLLRDVLYELQSLGEQLRQARQDALLRVSGGQSEALSGAPGVELPGMNFGRLELLLSDVLSRPMPEPAGVELQPLIDAVEAMRTDQGAYSERMMHSLGRSGGGTMSPDVVDRATRQLGIISGTVTTSTTATTPGYSAGTGGGTVNVPALKTLRAVSAYANGADGTFTVAGGAAVTVRSGQSLSWNPRGAYVAPAVILGASLDYLVEWDS